MYDVPMTNTIDAKLSEMQNTQAELERIELQKRMLSKDEEKQKAKLSSLLGELRLIQTYGQFSSVVALQGFYEVRGDFRRVFSFLPSYFKDLIYYLNATLKGTFDI